MKIWTFIHYTQILLLNHSESLSKVTFTDKVEKLSVRFLCYFIQIFG